MKKYRDTKQYETERRKKVRYNENKNNRISRIYENKKKRMKRIAGFRLENKMREGKY